MSSALFDGWVSEKRCSVVEVGLGVCYGREGAVIRCSDLHSFRRMVRYFLRVRFEGGTSSHCMVLEWAEDRQDFVGVLLKGFLRVYDKVKHVVS